MLIAKKIPKRRSNCYPTDFYHEIKEEPDTKRNECDTNWENIPILQMRNQNLEKGLVAAPK